MKQITIIFLLLLAGCASTAKFDDADNRAYENLKELVGSQRFEIISDYANPRASSGLYQLANTNLFGLGNTPSNISLIGNTNYLIVDGEQVKGFLPFYGEQYFGSNPFGNHQGIEFKGTPENYEVLFNEDKHNVLIQFEIDDFYRTQEHYEVRITIFQNNSSDIHIVSSRRSSIEYRGHVKPLKDEETSS